MVEFHERNRREHKCKAKRRDSIAPNPRFAALAETTATPPDTNARVALFFYMLTSGRSLCTYQTLANNGSL
jgi:hypothetical protein